MNGQLQDSISGRSLRNRFFLSKPKNFTGRIVGGKRSDIQEYPWQVSLHASASHQCGGSILTPSWERKKNA